VLCFRPRLSSRAWPLSLCLLAGASKACPNESTVSSQICSNACLKGRQWPGPSGRRSRPPTRACQERGTHMRAVPTPPARSRHTPEHRGAALVCHRVLPVIESRILKLGNSADCDAKVNQKNGRSHPGSAGFSWWTLRLGRALPPEPRCRRLLIPRFPISVAVSVFGTLLLFFRNANSLHSAQYKFQLLA
jgi:hypothetical protein